MNCEIKLRSEYEEEIVCSECGALFESGESVYEVDGKYYHAECLSDAGYEFCEECGELFKVEDCVYVEDLGFVCSECRWTSDYIFYCDGCDRYYNGRNVDFVSDGNVRLCEDCADNYRFCTNCDTLVHESNIYWLDDEPFCYDCYHEADSSRVIHQYGYKPDPKYKVRSSHKDCSMNAVDIKELLFGCELEVDKGNWEDKKDCAEAVVDAAGDNVYLKEDGSLDTGFEIVTHPCTLDYHMYEFPWRHICRRVVDHGFKSHDARTCGLHVHVGRYQLGDSLEERRDTTSKIIVLMHIFWDKLVKFSRRKDSQLDRWASAPLGVSYWLDRYRSGEDVLSYTLSAIYNENDDNRYKALNLQNRYTIEFRMFNGSLRRDTIIATLQLVNNICKMAKDYSLEAILNASWNDLVNYEPFAELVTYCESRGLGAASDAATTIASDEEFETKINPAGVLVNGARVVSISTPNRPMLCENVRGTIVATPTDNNGMSASNPELLYGMMIDDSSAIVWGTRDNFAVLGAYNS